MRSLLDHVEQQQQRQRAEPYASRPSLALASSPLAPLSSPSAASSSSSTTPIAAATATGTDFETSAHALEANMDAEDAGAAGMVAGNEESKTSGATACNNTSRNSEGSRRLAASSGSSSSLSQVLVSTVDAFQGGERDIVLICTTRTAVSPSPFSASDSNVALLLPGFRRFVARRQLQGAAASADTSKPPEADAYGKTLQRFSAPSLPLEQLALKFLLRVAARRHASSPLAFIESRTRTNVALTRGRHHLIVLGSSRALLCRQVWPPPAGLVQSLVASMRAAAGANPGQEALRNLSSTRTSTSGASGGAETDSTSAADTSRFLLWRQIVQRALKTSFSFHPHVKAFLAFLARMELTSEVFSQPPGQRLAGGAHAAAIHDDTDEEEAIVCAENDVAGGGEEYAEEDLEGDLEGDGDGEVEKDEGDE